MENNKILRLYSCVHAVRGYSSGIILDPQRNNYYKVPLAMLDLFDNNAEQYDNLKESLEDINDHFILDEYLAFLRTNELIFEIDADEIVLFPEISKQWDYPAHIVSAIIEICSSNLFYLKEMISQLAQLFQKKIFLGVFRYV